MEPEQMQDGKGTGKADKLDEPKMEAKPSKKKLEAPKEEQLIVQDLLGDFSEQTGASFG